jgi:B12-binding domain/radical SAM domain protein
MSLRVCAVAAPEYVSGRIRNNVLYSRAPASLYNACRYAAHASIAGEKIWGHSNWAGDRSQRAQSILMMHSLKEDLPVFEQMLIREKPNLLLIGAMSLCFPGAIACAKLAKEMFGDQICIVLGGRHVTETMYSTKTGIRHHKGSPLKLMEDGEIDHVFDLLVSGQGEFLVKELGSRIGELISLHQLPTSIKSNLDDIELTSGKWIIGWLKNGVSTTLASRGTEIDRNLLPVPCEMFGANSEFSVYPHRKTAHVFSDMSSGCVYDCNFCSERKSATGKLIQQSTAADRLYKQLETSVSVISKDYQGKFGASAFCEDSTLLGGIPSQLEKLAHMLHIKPINILFGGQFTIDQILARKEIIKKLGSAGLNYLFVGIETYDPQEIGGMSKVSKLRHGNWIERIESAFSILAEAGIRCGASLVFGLGESRNNRYKLFHQLDIWRKKFGSPHPVSMNWGVQHPLMGNDGQAGYNYVPWGTDDGELLDAFQSFGEASEKYPLSGISPPSLEEVKDVLDMYNSLSST